MIEMAVTVAVAVAAMIAPGSVGVGSAAGQPVVA